MTWKVELDPATVRDLDRLDKQIARLILNFFKRKSCKIRRSSLSWSGFTGAKVWRTLEVSSW